jgi:dienelactone hydrolase
MFEYFRQNYTWNLALMSALNRGGAIGEIDEACRSLQEASVRNDVFAQQAWYESWKKLAERVEALGLAHEQVGQYLSAGRKYIRASIYYLAAERMLSHRDPRKVQTYRQALLVFKKALELRKEPVEWVEVPFQGKSMPALFSRAPVKGRAPCMVHFDGFDVMKEIIYQYAGMAEEFRRRGISLLIVDHPGVGEALRLRNMHSGPDTEVPARACVDYLETRAEVDAQRIGIMALSLGGYYAPRAAAFEKRFKCCVAWGAVWESGLPAMLKGKGGEPSVPGLADHAMWVYGKDTIEETLAVVKQMTLEGVADKITCPLLVIHGENDRQVPLWRAEKTIEAAVNSPNRKLKVFTLAEGGAEHCQSDNSAMAVDYMADWVAEILGGNPKGI